MAQGSAGSLQVNASGNADIDGILWGYRWNTTNLTYSFPTAAAEYVGYETINGFEAFNAAQQAAVNAMARNVGAVCGLNLTLTTGVGANIRFAEADSIDYSTDPNVMLHVPGGANNSAEANVPDPTGFYTYTYGDTWFNHTSYNSPAAGDFAYAAGLMHEFGHALGLKHGHSEQVGHGVTFPTLPTDHDSQEFSIMTYRRYPGGPATGGSVNYPQTLMQDDIAALQYMYGANYNSQSGNSVYSWSSTTGQMSINGVAQNAPADNHIFLTVWDGGGVDTYDFSNYSTDLTVNLNPGAWTTASTNQLAYLGNDDGTNHFARGNIANALLFQGNTASLIENATGGSGGDSIVGNAVANVLRGGAGDDALFGGSGFIADADTLQGGPGADALFGDGGIDTADYSDSDAGVTVNLLTRTGSGGTAEGDTLFSIEILTGSSFGDILTGKSDTQRLNGLGGDDTLIASNTAELFGGTGDDTYVVDNLNNITEFIDQGHDTVRSSVRRELGANSNIEDLVLTGTANINGFGNELQNHLTGNSGNNYLQGFDNKDILEGGDGNDYYELSDRNFGLLFEGFDYDTVIEGPNGGIDFVNVTPVTTAAPGFASNYTLTADVENGAIIGTIAFNLTGNDIGNSLTGNSAANGLYGLGGNDSLNGGLGGDTLVGGTGDDLYSLDDLSRPNSFALYAYDTVIEAADEGTDTVVVTSMSNPNGVSTFGYTLGANVENGRVTGSIVFNLTGNELDNALTGNSAANRLTGLAGNDSFAGGLGGDTLVGGLGDDVYILDDLSRPNPFALYAYDAVTEAADEGTDTVVVTSMNNPNGVSTFGYALGANVENGQVTGSIAFNLTGNELDNVLLGNDAANVLTGNAGNDFFSGGFGDDTERGGMGDDTYFLSDTVFRSGVAGYDNVVEAGDEGTDTVLVGFRAFGPSGYTLGANVENGVVTDQFVATVIAFNLTGNELDNALTGNDAVNLLTGNDGNDALVGVGGDDVLNGGVGADLLDGGEGIDTADYTVAAAAVVADLLAPGANTGEAAGDSYVSVENLLGSGFDDLLFGDDGANALGGADGADGLFGRGGDDMLAGGIGDDLLDGGLGADSLDGGDGIDTASYAFAVSAVLADLLAAGANTGEAAGDSYVSIENLLGSGFKDVLNGDDAANTLDGGLGKDTLTGGAGDDSFFVDVKGDRVFEAVGGGNDAVLASATYSLQAGQGVETLETSDAAGTLAINLSGNGFDNRLIGNAGSNRLDGKAGSDTMSGLGGDDTYDVSSAGDQVVEDVGGGNDRVFASRSYTLSAGQEIERLDTADAAATTAINLTGNEFANIVIGNAGADILNGAGGNDRLTGGLGADTFFFNAAFDAATNVDRIMDFSVADDTIRLDDAIFAVLPRGTLADDGFFIGAAAHDADDRILYNAVNGDLKYDADGNGAGAAVLFAKLAPGLALTHDDFVVV